jgi:uncharacterized membrane protein
MNEGDQDKHDLDRLRKLSRPVRFLRAHSRLLASVALGLATLILLPDHLHWTSRALIAWDVTVALYLVASFATIRQAPISHIRNHAIASDDGRFAILALTAGAALASIVAIIVELGASGRGAQQVALVIVTIALSWTMVHMIFAFHYAHDYYRPRQPGGLKFPDEDKPDYWDFIYFSFVIGMTAQVSDVAITDRTIRRTATAHGVISFVFNTALLALMVNIAASAL